MRKLNEKHHRHIWKTTGGSRFDVSFECEQCGQTKDIHEGVIKTITKYGK